MTYEEVIDHFGTAYQIAKHLGFSQNTPRNWRKIGYIPIEAQMKIEAYTEGLLSADFEDFKRRKGAL